MSARPVIVAIDGPAGAGKSTASRLVAARLGFAMVDTGAIYRAVALAAAMPDGAAASIWRAKAAPAGTRRPLRASAAAAREASVTAREADIERPTPIEPTPVDTDDLLNLHLFLNRFDGNFQRLFGRESDA